jgi:hypothetical protein
MSQNFAPCAGTTSFATFATAFALVTLFAFAFTVACTIAPFGAACSLRLGFFLSQVRCLRPLLVRFREVFLACCKPHVWFSGLGLVVVIIVLWSVVVVVVVVLSEATQRRMPA